MQRFSEHLTPAQVQERNKDVADLTHEVLTHHLEELPEARPNTTGALADMHRVYSQVRPVDHDALTADLKGLGWRGKDHVDYMLHDYLQDERLDFNRAGGSYTVIHRRPPDKKGY